MSVTNFSKFIKSVKSCLTIVNQKYKVAIPVTHDFNTYSQSFIDSVLGLIEISKLKLKDKDLITRPPVSTNLPLYELELEELVKEILSGTTPANKREILNSKDLHPHVREFLRQLTTTEGISFGSEHFPRATISAVLRKVFPKPVTEKYSSNHGLVEVESLSDRFIESSYSYDIHTLDHRILVDVKTIDDERTVTLIPVGSKSKAKTCERALSEDLTSLFEDCDDGIYDAYLYIYESKGNNTIIKNPTKNCYFHIKVHNPIDKVYNTELEPLFKEQDYGFMKVTIDCFNIRQEHGPKFVFNSYYCLPQYYDEDYHALKKYNFVVVGRLTSVDPLSPKKYLILAYIDDSSSLVVCGKIKDEAMYNPPTTNVQDLPLPVVHDQSLTEGFKVDWFNMGTMEDEPVILMCQVDAKNFTIVKKSSFFKITFRSVPNVLYSLVLSKSKASKVSSLSKLCK